MKIISVLILIFVVSSCSAFGGDDDTLTPTPSTITPNPMPEPMPMPDPSVCPPGQVENPGTAGGCFPQRNCPDGTFLGTRFCVSKVDTPAPRTCGPTNRDPAINTHFEECTVGQRLENWSEYYLPGLFDLTLSHIRAKVDRRMEGENEIVEFSDIGDAPRVKWALFEEFFDRHEINMRGVATALIGIITRDFALLPRENIFLTQ